MKSCLSLAGLCHPGSGSIWLNTNKRHGFDLGSGEMENENGQARRVCIRPGQWLMAALSASRHRWFSAGVPTEMRIHSGN
jgi:hypothetical protein